MAYRLGAQQEAKLRACDDLKHSLANRFCRNKTPIQLVTWGHISKLSRLLTQDGGEWHLCKADREAAYKQLPISPDDQWAEIVAMRHPTSGKWFGFVTRTPVFGSVAALLHYNILSGIWKALASHLLGTPQWCILATFPP